MIEVNMANGEFTSQTARKAIPGGQAFDASDWKAHAKFASDCLENECSAYVGGIANKIDT